MSGEKFVKIKPERGYPSGIYVVQSSQGSGACSEYNLKHMETGDKVTIYQVHCFRDIECLRYQPNLNIRIKNRGNRTRN